MGESDIRIKIEGENFGAFRTGDPSKVMYQDAYGKSYEFVAETYKNIEESTNLKKRLCTVVFTDAEGKTHCEEIFAVVDFTTGKIYMQLDPAIEQARKEQKENLFSVTESTKCPPSSNEGVPGIEAKETKEYLLSYRLQQMALCEDETSSLPSFNIKSEGRGIRAGTSRGIRHMRESDCEDFSDVEIVENPKEDPIVISDNDSEDGGTPQSRRPADSPATGTRSASPLFGRFSPIVGERNVPPESDDDDENSDADVEYTPIGSSDEESDYRNNPGIVNIEIPPGGAGVPYRGAVRIKAGQPSNNEPQILLPNYRPLRFNTIASAEKGLGPTLFHSLTINAEDGELTLPTHFRALRYNNDEESKPTPRDQALRIIAENQLEAVRTRYRPLIFDVKDEQEEPSPVEEESSPVEEVSSPVEAEEIPPTPGTSKDGELPTTNNQKAIDFVSLFETDTEEPEGGEFINFEKRCKDERQGIQAIFDAVKTHFGPQAGSYRPLDWVPLWSVDFIPGTLCSTWKNKKNQRKQKTCRKKTSNPAPSKFQENPGPSNVNNENETSNLEESISMAGNDKETSNQIDNEVPSTSAEKSVKNYSQVLDEQRITDSSTSSDMSITLIDSEGTSKEVCGNKPILRKYTRKSKNISNQSFSENRAQIAHSTPFKIPKNDCSIPDRLQSDTNVVTETTNKVNINKPETKRKLRRNSSFLIPLTRNTKASEIQTRKTKDSEIQTSSSSGCEMQTTNMKDSGTQTSDGLLKSLLPQLIQSCEIQPPKEKVESNADNCDETTLLCENEVEPVDEKPNLRPVSPDGPFQGFSEEVFQASTIMSMFSKTPITAPDGKYYTVVYQKRELRPPHGMFMECVYCKRRFLKKDLLNLHIQEKHLKGRKTGKIFECEKCDYAGRSAHLLEIHMKQHKSTKMYQCILCSFVSRHTSHVTRHYRCKHLKLQKYKCEECRYTTSEASVLKLHVLRLHRGAEPKFKCPQCDYKSHTRASVNNHVQTVHDRVHVFKCPECKFSTHFKSNLKMHVESVHLNIRDFECTFCSSKFYRLTHLKRHMAKIHSNKPGKRGKSSKK